MISIPQEVLASALNAVTRASLKSSLVAAFALVRLDANASGELSLSCFNGDTAARAVVYAACNDDLSISVDAQTLKAVTDTLVGEVRLELVDKALVILNGANRTTLRILEETIPVIGGESTSDLFTLSGLALRSLCRVLPFASTDDSRPALQIVHLTASDQGIVAQAADGFTAGIVSENFIEAKEKAVVSLPANFARLLVALVEEKDTVQVQSAGETRFLFQITQSETSKNLTLATLAPASAFPAEQLAQLLQSAQASITTRISIQKQALLQTVRMVGAMGTQNTFLKIANGAIKVASAPTDTGQARNILDGVATGSDAKVWLSALYLKRAVDACKAELTVQLGGEKKPVLLIEGSFTAILMPLFVDGKDPFADEDEPIAISLPMMQSADA
jgi:DNA polymerase III sliding clamp (beta) subunit (PCNA family)